MSCTALLRRPMLRWFLFPSPAALAPLIECSPHLVELVQKEVPWIYRPALLEGGLVGLVRHHVWFRPAVVKMFACSRCTVVFELASVWLFLTSASDASSFSLRCVMQPLERAFCVAHPIVILMALISLRLPRRASQ